MAIDNKKLTKAQDKQLRTLLDLESGLSDFEVEFVESISHQTFALTDKQADKLKEIYDDKG